MFNPVCSLALPNLNTKSAELSYSPRDSLAKLKIFCSRAYRSSVELVILRNRPSIDAVISDVCNSFRGNSIIALRAIPPAIPATPAIAPVAAVLKPPPLEEPPPLGALGTTTGLPIPFNLACAFLAIWIILPRAELSILTAIRCPSLDNALAVGCALLSSAFILD